MRAARRTSKLSAQASFYLGQQEFLAKQDLVYEPIPTHCWAVQENTHYYKAQNQGP